MNTEAYALGLVILGTSLALAGEDKDQGFESIFDGKTLKGWHVSAQTGHSRASQNQTGGRWVVEQGAIVGSQDIPGNGGILITDERFGDFEVVLEMNNDFGPDNWHNPSPSRYGILTGRYSWRTGVRRGNPSEAEPWINQGRIAMPEMLRRQRYQTAVFGIRTLAIHHTGMSDTLALRKGDWILIDGPTGDNGRQEPEWIRRERGVEPHTQPVELFNLKTDPQQTKNLAAEHLEKVEELKKLLSQLEESGRTRPE